LDKHDAATGGRKFNATLATASINDAIEYFNLFKSLQDEKKKSDPAFRPLEDARFSVETSDGDTQ
jgi:type I restriction enzyme, R subunit